MIQRSPACTLPEACREGLRTVERRLLARIKDKETLRSIDVPETMMIEFFRGSGHGLMTVKSRSVLLKINLTHFLK